MKMYKIPRREVYCDTLRSWFHELLWVFLVMKLFRNDISEIGPFPTHELKSMAAGPDDRT